jgi:molybdopterin/thiamine biosynthesis adenylyltransferase
MATTMATRPFSTAGADSGGRALIVGAGGLGCPAALALAAAGVRALGVMDDDVVDASNLHRQIWHSEGTVGMNKAASLARALRERFPDVAVAVHETRFSVETAAILESYDVIVDATDNFAAKFLLNDAAVLARKPLVHAAAVEMHGQILTVPAGGAPCYRCLFEEMPPAGVGPSCTEQGVLGPVPGVLGSLQGAEAARLLRGEAPAFVGRLVQYDAASLNAREVRYKRNPACAVCGDSPRVRALDPAEYPSQVCA